MTNKKYRKNIMTPNIIKNFVYLKTHCRANEYYLNFKSNKLNDIDFAISHFEYANLLINDILKDLRKLKLNQKHGKKSI